MPYYKDAIYLHESRAQAFDHVLTPGFRTPFSGIYRCEGCGFEIASARGQPLPADDHRGHVTSQGAIRWRLVAQATHEKV